MSKLRLATVWLGGCSGCHMSLLDIDEWLIELAGQVDLVYSPLIDVKEYPEHVDLALVEGAVANEDHLRMIREVRERSKLLISFGDCAVTGNVTAMRNGLRTAEPVLKRAYLDPSNLRPRLPQAPGILPPLLDRVSPVHEAVPVDYFLPGCPPPASRIRRLLQAVLAGKAPQWEGRDLSFG